MPEIYTGSRKDPEEENTTDIFLKKSLFEHFSTLNTQINCEIVSLQIAASAFWTLRKQVFIVLLQLYGKSGFLVLCLDIASFFSFSWCGTRSANRIFLIRERRSVSWVSKYIVAQRFAGLSLVLYIEQSETNSTKTAV